MMAFLALFLFYLYFKLKYFTLRGPIPGLKPQFFFGNLLNSGLMSEKMVYPVIMKLQRKFGDVFQFWLGASRFIVLSNAEDVDHVFSSRNTYGPSTQNTMVLKLFLHDALICTEGSKHRQHASLITPCLRRNKLTKFFHWMLECVERSLIDGWRHSEPDFIHTDILPKAKKIILRIFAQIAFEVDLEPSVEKDLHQALYDVSALFTNLLVLPMSMIKIYLTFSPTYRRVRKTFSDYSNQILNSVRSEEQTFDDDKRASSLVESLTDAVKGNGKTAISMKEFVDETLFLHLSGYESSWTALIWFIFHMSKNPRIQAKIKAEMSSIEYPCTIEQFDSLTYLNAVIYEVLRYAPPFEYNVRSVEADDYLPGTKTHVNKGDEIMISTHALGRDPRYWAIDPNVFYPERYLPENNEKRHASFGLLAFGAGPRKCCGQDLAFFELKTIAFSLMKHVTFGDGGADSNNGAPTQNLATNLPYPIGVTVAFD